MKRAIIEPIATVAAAEVAGCRGATIKVMPRSPDVDDPASFHTRIFTLAAGGHIPAHRHDVCEHQQIFLEGEVHLALDGQQRVARAGDTVYIPAGVAHAYDNQGDTPARFVCIIPAGDYQTEWL